MKSFGIKIVISALALMAVAYIVPGISVDNIYIALLAALALGVLNALVRPLLFILTLPITVVTLGLFIFIINAILFWFASSVIPGFAVAGFFPALVGSLLLSVFSTVGNKLLT